VAAAPSSGGLLVGDPYPGALALLGCFERKGVGGGDGGEVLYVAGELSVDKAGFYGINIKISHK
jgi:hypothetical protein